MVVAVSGDLPVDAPPESSAPATISVHAGASPAWADEPVDPMHTLHATADDEASLVEVAWTSRGSGIRLRYAEGATFHVAAELDEIWFVWTAPLTDADAAQLLLEPVLAFVLRQRGALVLHASGIAFDGGAVAICGDAGAGKSMTAAACLLAGATLVSDDVVAVARNGDGWHAHPGTRSCRVWDDGARTLLGDPARANVFSPTWHKRVIVPAMLRGTVATAPVPLALVCVLGDRDGTAPVLTRLTGYKAVRALVPNASAQWAHDVAQRGAALRTVAMLATDVPVARLVPPDDPAALPRVVDAIRHAAGG